MGIWSDINGVLVNLFRVGKSGGGNRTFRFFNGFSGDLIWNPTANRTIKFPDADPQAGQILQSSDTSGNLQWAFPGVPTGTEVTGTSATMAANRSYIANNASLVTLTLPTTAAQFSMIFISGKGAGLWRIAQNSGQQIQYGDKSTTSGTGGRIDATHRRDVLALICTTTDSEWTVLYGVGNPDMV